jgi:hypothetical protein
LTWISKNIRFENHTIEPAMGADPFDLVTIDALLEGGMQRILQTPQSLTV